MLYFRLYKTNDLIGLDNTDMYKTFNKVDNGNLVVTEAGLQQLSTVGKDLIKGYCAFHVLVQTNFRRYCFYFLPDQAQILLGHFNVLDELRGEISTGFDNI